jgi:hypothetical protein
MSVRESGKSLTVQNSWRATTRHELIIEVWEALDCESVGALELEQIQQVLGQKFGAGAVESPAAIARVVADEGAVLRHPEVFESDMKWRTGKATALGHNLDFSSLKSALESFRAIETHKSELEKTKDHAGQQHLNEVIAAARQDALLLERSRILAARERAEAKEASEWLRVWLVAPELFRDWLELRMRSAEFRRSFAEHDSDDD